MRVLLTAFEPFAGATLNASLEASRLVASAPLPDEIELETVTLPCTFAGAPVTLRSAITRFEPDLVIASGEAGDRPEVTVEVVALNRDDAGIPDNAGEQPVESTILPGGPAAYFSQLPVKACVQAITAAGIPASESYTAGTYVCNHLAYWLAHFIATERPQLRGGFVHLPRTPAQVATATATEPRPSMAAATSAAALRIVIQTVAETNIGTA